MPPNFNTSVSNFCGVSNRPKAAFDTPIKPWSASEPPSEDNRTGVPRDGAQESRTPPLNLRQNVGIVPSRSGPRPLKVGGSRGPSGGAGTLCATASTTQQPTKSLQDNANFFCGLLRARLPYLEPVMPSPSRRSPLRRPPWRRRRWRRAFDQPLGGPFTVVDQDLIACPSARPRRRPRCLWRSSRWRHRPTK